MAAEGVSSPQPKLQVILLFPANATLFATAKSHCGLGEEKEASKQIPGWWKPVTFGVAVDVYLRQQTLVTGEGSSPAARAHVLPMALGSGLPGKRCDLCEIPGDPQLGSTAKGHDTVQRRSYTHPRLLGQSHSRSVMG